MKILSSKIAFFAEVAEKEMFLQLNKFSESIVSEKSTVEELRGWIIRDVEIFKAGTYREIPYTEDHLDEMVANFDILKSSGTFEPVFKKDHSESVDNQLGWITNVYREGDLLKGDLHITEWTAMDKIENKTWKYLSSEIYPPDLATAEFGDIISGHVLRGVAVVSVPKVKGLKGIVLNSELIEQEGGNIVNREQVEALMRKLGKFTEDEIKAFSDEEIFAKFSEKFLEDPTPATPPAAPAAPAAPAVFGEGQFVVMSKDDFTAIVDKSVGAENKAIDFFAEVTRLSQESKTEKTTRKVDALLAAGKITPAEKEDVLTFSESLEGAPLDAYFATLEKRVPVVTFGENGAHQHGDPDDDDKAFEAFSERKKSKLYE